MNTRDLLASLGIEHATVLGHSMGGMVATRFALMYPEFTTHLILENSIGLEDYSEATPYVPTQKLCEQQLSMTEEKIRSYQKHYYHEWKPAYNDSEIPRAKLVEIENCGHLPHFEAPDQFYAAFLSFPK